MSKFSFLCKPVCVALRCCGLTCGMGLFLSGLMSSQVMGNEGESGNVYSVMLEAQMQKANEMMQQRMQESLDLTGDQGQVTFEQPPIDTNLDWTSVPEEEVMEGIRLYQQQDFLSARLEPMFRVKKPSLSAKHLTPEESNFCLLVQSQSVEDLTNINPQCLVMSNYVQKASLNFKRYATLIGALEIFRLKYELGLNNDDLQELFVLDQVYSDADKHMAKLYDMPTKPAGETLTLDETNACFEVIVLQEMFLEGLKVGYPLERVNHVNTVYNQKCKGRVIRAREFFQRTMNLNVLQNIAPVVAEIIHRATENIKPNTFLYPFNGSDNQRTPEIIEAQKYLKQLGYLYNQPTGVVDYSTTNAIMEFERDLGLVQTGVLSFSNLMRLRLFTVGYDPKYLL